MEPSDTDGLGAALYDRREIPLRIPPERLRIFPGHLQTVRPEDSSRAMFTDSAP